MSTFAWLDYSEKQRQQMLDVVSLFREKETRDELGIGIIRDAFADLLFPGTSTIQTRARYFLFVPWIYLHIEKKGVPSSKVSSKARTDEIALIRALKRSGVEEGEGLIGARAEGHLQRLPSNVYWQGLHLWGLRMSADSQYIYHRSLDGFYRRSRQIKANNQHEDWWEPLEHNWHPGLAALIPKGFPEGVSFNLASLEAEYLRERILTVQSGTLLAYLVTNAKPWDSVPFPWAHPLLTECPPRLQEQLVHARNFSEVIYGAPLLYNLMLAEKAQWQEKIDDYRSAITNWAQDLLSRQLELGSWDWRDRFWEIVQVGNARISLRVKQFMESWLSMALDPSIAIIMADHAPARRLIHHRERQLKHSLARLDNPRALELWGGAAGIGRLNYRWNTAQTLLSDILSGENNLA